MRRLHSVALLTAAGLAVSTAVGAAGPAPAAAPPAPDRTSAAAALPKLSAISVGFRKRVGGLASPTQVTNARDGSPRLFVTELGGRVRVYRGEGRLQGRPYLDLRSKVRSGGEQGLLGIAFRSDFARTRNFWVSYVANDGSLQISRFKARTKKAPTVSASTERPVLKVPHPGYTNHNGGSLAFGNDGYLYVGTGDGGGAGDPGGNAQDRNSLLGKILRIDVTRSCGGKRYCVPRSNPFVGKTPGKGSIWAYGLRNPWRTSIDPRTGALWIGDVGQDRYEEIDRIPAGAGGRNLGWPCREGTQPYAPARCSSSARLYGPVAAYSHDKGRSVTGGVVYRGSRYRQLLAGRYVFADFISGRVWVRGASGAVRQVGRQPNLSSFGVSGSGEVFAVGFDGGLYALTARRR